MNKAKSTDRIYDDNIEAYAQKTYGNCTKLIIETGLPKFVTLLQSDYGEELDCSIIAITVCLCYMLNRTDYRLVYNTVEKIGKKLGYNGTTKGTPVAAIPKIAEDSCKELRSSLKWTAKIAKGVGFNLDFIKGQLNRKKPLILNLRNDPYYGSHSVAIVGYTSFLCNNKERVFLKIGDGWSKTFSYIDYDRLSILSSLSYIK